MQSRASLAFADAIKSANNDINRMRNNKAALMANRKLLNKVGRMIGKSLGDCDHMFMSNDYTGHPYIHIALYDLDSFKCLKLETLMATLLSLGDAKATKDWPSALNRDYEFDLGWFDVKVSAYVRDDSPTCRKVVVGTETRQVETYKIVCD